MLEIESEAVAAKVSLRKWFADFVVLRNKTRGHGAPLAGRCGQVCQDFLRSLETIHSNFCLFQRPWAYLHRNLSGKYRVTPLTADASPFAPLTKTTDRSHPNGVYIYYSEPRRVDLLLSDPDASDFFLPNGNFSARYYEWLSYVTGHQDQGDALDYRTPPDKLPASESQGLGQLEVIGSLFGNVPSLPKKYITRSTLESELTEQLNLRDRHPVITLTGPGGSGKTSLALKVLHRVASSEAPPFQAIVWFSARDIDLLPEGPKVVQPHVITIEEFGQEYVRLIEPANRSEKGFRPLDYLAAELSRSSVGPVLFVFDNFETVKNPVEVYNWIDTYIRMPNKVLITTRKREFLGDYPIEVSGMSEDECNELIRTVGSDLGIISILTEAYCQEVFHESEGHPYVIKILLGEVARNREVRKVERIMGSQDHVLTALFERTYGMLTPASQRVFLTLSNWHSTIPEVALAAVLLRPQNERLDFSSALDELVKSSFAELLPSDSGGNLVNVPLAARMFGRRKLEVSPWKPAVVADTEILQLLGADRKSESRLDSSRRLERLFSSAAKMIDSKKYEIGTLRPILEYVAQSYHRGWLLLADLFTEGGPAQDLEEAKKCLRTYLEKPDDDDVSRVWKNLADVCAKTKDDLGEVHALSTMCSVPDLPLYVVSSAANRINGTLHRSELSLPQEELQALLQGVIDRMEEGRARLSADDCSRLAWLYMQLHDDGRAQLAAMDGVKQEPGNPHCVSLLKRWPQLDCVDQG